MVSMLQEHTKLKPFSAAFETEKLSLARKILFWAYAQ